MSATLRSRRATRPGKPQPPAPSESQTQAAVIEWASFTPMPQRPGVEPHARVSSYLIAIPNDGKRSLAAGAQAKRTGLTPGVSDLFLAYPTARAAGLWIEMKVRPRKPTPAQVAWIQRMRLAGYEAHLAYTYEEAVRLISDHLGLARQ